MPAPKKGESKQEYVSRFMSSEEAKRDYPDQKQRLAVAYSKWENKEVDKVKKSAYIIQENLKMVAKAKEGDTRMIFGKPATYTSGKWVTDGGGQPKPEGEPQAPMDDEGLSPEEHGEVSDIDIENMIESDRDYYLSRRAEQYMEEGYDESTSFDMAGGDDLFAIFGDEIRQELSEDDESPDGGTSDIGGIASTPMMPDGNIDIRPSGKKLNQDPTAFRDEMEKQLLDYGYEPDKAQQRAEALTNDSRNLDLWTPKQIVENFKQNGFLMWQPPASDSVDKSKWKPEIGKACDDVKKSMSTIRKNLAGVHDALIRHGATSTVENHSHGYKIDRDGNGTTDGDIGEFETKHVHDIKNHEVKEAQGHTHQLI